MSDGLLDILGLRRGEPIRFKRMEGRRWERGAVYRVEADGSITLHDADGAARSYWPEQVQIRRPGSRGQLVWCTVSEVAVTWEQLEMFPDLGASNARRGNR